MATAMVASAAWPLYGSARASAPRPDAVDGDGDPGELARTGRRLRLGIVLTFVAVAMTALGATSSWWPRGAAPEPGSVEVSTDNGVACGELREAQPGILAIDAAGRSVAVALSDVRQLRPVSACP